MGTFVDMTGQRYGRLTVVGRAGHNKHGQILWRALCDCGGSVETVGYCIRYGDTQSCGCLKLEKISALRRTHAMSKTPIYGIWWAMMQRCHDPNHHASHRYGGRGIEVCEQWRSFDGFFADMGHRPEGMSLDRVDNNGPYSPENVRWRSAREQGRNKNNNRLISHNGVTKCLVEWGEITGFGQDVISARLSRGWDVARALTTPLRQNNRAA